MQRSLIGAKLRARRKALGISQSALAERAGISASYLNLIEGDRRNIGGALLKCIADALGVPLDAVDGAAERRLAQALGEIRVVPLLGALGLDASAIPELVSRHPAWAHALVSLHRAYVDGNAAVNALADRLTQDPALSDAVHLLLTHVSSIRSASEILAHEEGLDATQRRRFVANVVDDSRRLSDVAELLAGFFSGSQTGTGSITPAEEVDDLFIDQDSHFPRLEAAALQLRSLIGLDVASAETALTHYLEQAHGVAVSRAAAVPASVSGAPRQLSHFQDVEATFVLSEASAEQTRRFELARLVAQLGAADAIDEVLAATPTLLSAAARQRARRALAAYVAGALLMPYDDFLASAAALRYDIDRLASGFGCSVEQVCHRLVTLRRPGAEGVRFGFLRANVAGLVSKRMPLPRLPLPRYGAVCPIWAVYEAFQANGALVRQHVCFPDGERFLMLARTTEKERAVFGMPRHLVSVMLMCEVLDADRIVYADGMNLAPTAPATPVGSTCRVCVRERCAFRQEERIVSGSPQ